MLAYASARPVAGKRESSPNALLLVISVHVALLALLMSTKVDVGRTIPKNPRLIEIPVAKPPPPPNETRIARPRPQPAPLNIDHSIRRVPTVDPAPLPVDASGPSIGSIVGGGSVAGNLPEILPSIIPVHNDARLLTPPSELKPPYPASKLASEEEATLRLELTIDERGRVIAVDSLGNADREFLESARRYIMAHWRYEPASENGRATSSRIAVTLRFQLDG